MDAAALGRRRADLQADIDGFGLETGVDRAVAVGRNNSSFRPAPAVVELDTPGHAAVRAVDWDQDGDVDTFDLNGLEQSYEATPEDCDNNGTWDLVQILTQNGDTDGNGILDACEAPFFRRGDGNLDGALDISDAVSLLSALFLLLTPFFTCFSLMQQTDEDNLTFVSNI